VAERYVLDIGQVAVARADISPGIDVLDVATGTGNAAIPAAQSGARVTGLDFAPELLSVARERAGQADVEIDWVEGDAEALPFGDDSYDRVLSVLGVQFAPRHEVVAAELARVLRPGGSIVLCSWTPGSLIGEILRTVGGRMPKPPEGVSPPPLWGDADHVSGLFAGTGLAFAFESHSVDFVEASPAGFVDYMADQYGPLHTARKKLGADGWNALRDELVAVCERRNVAGAGGFRAPSEYLVAVSGSGA
jgi:SAM-dependent methyltransferase